MSDIGQFILNSAAGLITGGIAAGITAAFTAKFAINRFYKEKWWERKHHAYNLLVESLVEIKNIYDRASCHLQRVHEKENDIKYTVSPDDYVFDWGNLHELGIQIRRLYILAPISLSKNAMQLLDEYFKTSKDIEYAIHEEGFPDFIGYGELADKIQSTINSIVNDARKELNFT
ncbi:hypothetical protein [Providencia huaxiensis]|uniref:Uncharacterized protein n=1 Tax=Providencia huaxiensis TaxID=2027290 RepID=A0A8I2D8U4_9GAMM|nr:hypothetical protein [Providencia huaxiensis]MBQ0266767.1 hypothetical protein [Providencia huaxiensis]